ncbi:hypothetical protein DI272_10835 [Streptomyces sp. Act143]|uniref:hypothetical protein n=1 Tax=Streptomyces sp. Act143 TaxID=2200760 RepID=UPI000D67A15E|nr:hypothetical protein [Streptomyces sp. Act143]PWI14598.1 hypothetical protein DI272_10835 [Streptomyces sp. Act143]
MDERGERERAYAAEGVVWSRLAGLLPGAEDVAEIQACWDIGEQEGGLFRLVDRLFARELSVADRTRAELAAMAEQWGVWDQLATDVVDLPGFEGELRVVEGLEPVDRAGGTTLVAWMRCEPCGRILAREHRREAWGGLSFSPVSYVVSVPDGSGTQIVVDAEGAGAVWRALDLLTASCREAAACPGFGPTG